MSEEARLGHCLEENNSLGVEIKELRRLLRASNDERDSLRVAVNSWESRCDTLIEALGALAERDR